MNADIAVMVPKLVLREDLDEPHAPFDQPPGNQTAAAIVLGGRVVHAVHCLRRLSFFAQIECFTCGGLHLARQVRSWRCGPAGRVHRDARQVPPFNRRQGTPEPDPAAFRPADVGGHLG